MRQHEIKLRLPFPPSVNTYWRNTIHRGRPRTLISRKGRKYRAEVQALILPLGLPQTHERLHVIVHATMPDCRTRDLDNLPKSLLDAIGSAGVYGDDSQIDHLEVVRGPVQKPGWVDVTIHRLDDGKDSA